MSDLLRELRRVNAKLNRARVGLDRYAARKGVPLRREPDFARSHRPRVLKALGDGKAERFMLDMARRLRRPA
jgi:hypothetical protein